MSLIVSLGLPPVALTMALVWKAKEAIVTDVYRDQRDTLPAGLP